MRNQDGVSAVLFDNVAKHFSATSGARHTAVQGVSLQAREGTFLGVVGPSGCGKSTLLNLAAGLMAPSEGSVEIYGKRLSGLNRRASYMFQQDALLPWKTVLENVTLGLTFKGQNGNEALESGRKWISRVGLDGFADSYPHQLSGGMRKRVAMAQNWIVNPDMLLMDEPFSALDIHTRLKMEQELLQLWSDARKTVLFVTHDLEEAIALSENARAIPSPSSPTAARIVIASRQTAVPQHHSIPCCPAPPSADSESATHLMATRRATFSPRRASC